MYYIQLGVEQFLYKILSSPLKTRPLLKYGKMTEPGSFIIKFHLDKCIYQALPRCFCKKAFQALKNSEKVYQIWRMRVLHSKGPLKWYTEFVSLILKSVEFHSEKIHLLEIARVFLSEGPSKRRLRSKLKCDEVSYHVWQFLLQCLENFQMGIIQTRLLLKTRFCSRLRYYEILSILNLVIL